MEEELLPLYVALAGFAVSAALLVAALIFDHSLADNSQSPDD